MLVRPERSWGGKARARLATVIQTQLKSGFLPSSILLSGSCTCFCCPYPRAPQGQEAVRSTSSQKPGKLPRVCISFVFCPCLPWGPHSWLGWGEHGRTMKSNEELATIFIRMYILHAPAPPDPSQTPFSFGIDGFGKTVNKACLRGFWGGFSKWATLIRPLRSRRQTLDLVQEES